MNDHLNYELVISEKHKKFTKKNKWLENNRNIQNAHKHMAREAMKPMQLLESKKSAVNYYVFNSCDITLVTKRLYDDDTFAVKSLLNKAYFSIWKAHTDEIIEQKKNKHILEMKKRESFHPASA